MSNIKFENILKDKDFELFKKDASFDISFLKKLLPYISHEKLYKIDIEGRILKRDFIPILKLVELYFCERKEKLLKDIFEYLVNQRSKMKFRKIFRYSTIDLEKVKDNFFKTLFNRNINFSMRYGKELFLRDRYGFENILLKSSLINFGYKSAYALSLIKLLKLFPQALDELLYIFLTFYCNEENNLYFYNRAYFRDSENRYGDSSFEKVIRAPYSSLKLYIKQDTREALNRLIGLVLKDINKVDLCYLMQLKSTVYFFNFYKNEESVQNIILGMFIALSEYTLREDVNEGDYIKEYIVKNLEMLV